MLSFTKSRFSGEKLFFVISFLIFALLLSANVLEQFEEFKRDISRQTEQWQGTHQSNRNSRDYQIGDTNVFWSWNLTVMPPLWIQVPSTCRAVGDHCYIFVADNQWNVHMDQADIDIILPYLEDYTMNSTEYGVIEMDELLFGPIPDELDNDPKIIVFYSELGSFMGTSFDGYFSAYNQVTEQQAQQMNPPGHSNECEMIYMTCFPLNPTDPIRISVLAHELQHMIHWLGDINEDTWVNEGCSELAMVYFGLPDPIVQFPSNPDNTLTFWDQEFADYVKVMLYFTYLEEQYDAVGDSLIKDIVSEPANSITGITNQLIANNISQSFEEIFVDWTIANFLDDPDVGSGQYNYESLDLPNFSAVYTHSAYPAGNNGSVNAWAADYIRLYPADGNLELDLTTSLPISLGAIRIGNAGITSTVDTYIVSGTWNGVLPELTEDYSQMILVFSNNGYSGVTYTYSIAEVISDVEQELLNPSVSLFNHPNPFNPSTTIYFTAENAENAEISIYNLKGEKIKSLPVILSPSSLLRTGFVEGSITWNGTDENYQPLSSGIYFYKLRSGDIEISKKMLLLK
ncbi:MAG: T9SS type A sorting domain-containing protein [Candidatus Cloacimonetes bacterium]|nr:T9SS type A sorting domain-containing protein [Candidatus Cloacimonadota bacterium]